MHYIPALQCDATNSDKPNRTAGYIFNSTPLQYIAGYSATKPTPVSDLMSFSSPSQPTNHWHGENVHFARQHPRQSNCAITPRCPVATWIRSRFTSGDSTSPTSKTTNPSTGVPERRASVTPLTYFNPTNTGGC